MRDEERGSRGRERGEKKRGEGEREQSPQHDPMSYPVLVVVFCSVIMVLIWSIV